MTRLAPHDLVRITAAAERAVNRNATVSLHLAPHQLQTLLLHVEDALHGVSNDPMPPGINVEDWALSKVPLDPAGEGERDQVIRDVILLRTLRRAAASEFRNVA